MGRRHRPFFRVCAVDSRASRDGRVIEYLGHYDPLVKETDARAILNGERIAHWLSVGALPTEKVRVLIKKYGENGTHLGAQEAALERLKTSKPTAPPPVPFSRRKQQEPDAESSESAEAPDATPGEETE